jgi:hypothetical protein
MNEDFDYSIIPDHFVYCVNSSCPRAEECMRHQLLAYATETFPMFRIVNPSYTAADCASFTPHEKVSFGLGIKYMLDKIPLATANRIKQRLIAQYSSTTFYRWRRGAKLVTPEEQEAIRRAFRQEGITEEPQYDKMVRRYVWQTAMLKDWTH